MLILLVQKGIVRMTHDFQTAVVDLHGVHETLHLERPFGGKNIDVLCKLFADSIKTGKRNSRLPFIRDYRYCLRECMALSERCPPACSSGNW